MRMREYVLDCRDGVTVFDKRGAGFDMHRLVQLCRDGHLGNSRAKWQGGVLEALFGEVRPGWV